MTPLISVIALVRFWIESGIRISRNALIDLRYGGLLAGAITTRYAHLGAKNVTNTDYAYLSNVFKNRIKPTDVLVDIGCGKGRVINFWLGCAPHNRIIGIELDDALAVKTRQRLRKRKNVTIISGDAISNIPVD